MIISLVCEHLARNHLEMFPPEGALDVFLRDCTPASRRPLRNAFRSHDIEILEIMGTVPLSTDSDWRAVAEESDSGAVTIEARSFNVQFSLFIWDPWSSGKRDVECVWRRTESVASLEAAARVGIWFDAAIRAGRALGAQWASLPELAIPEGAIIWRQGD